MSLKEKINKRAYPAVLSGLVLIAAYIQVNMVFGVEINILDILLATFVILTAVFIVDYLSKIPEFCIVSVILVLVGAFIAWCCKDDVLSFVKSDKRIWIFGLMALVGILLYISQQFFALRIIVCVGYWGAMLVLISINLFPVRQVMFCLAAELVLVIMEIANNRFGGKREKKEIQHKKMLFLTPVVLVVMLVLSVLPYSTEPIDWETAYEWAREQLERFDISDDDASGVGFAGYSESATLHGHKIEIDRETLKLTMLDNREHVYLVGNIKSDYTGDGWVGNPKNTAYKGNYTEYEFDAVEFLYAMYRAGIIDGTTPADEGGKSTWYLRLREVTVEYDGMRTSSLFRPSKTMRINTKKYDGDILDRKDDISFSKKQDVDTNYTLKYFSVNRGTGVATDLLKEQSKYRYSTMSESEYENFRRVVNFEYHTMGLPDTEDFEKELSERADYIRATYLGIPDGITEKTYNLAKKITAGCGNDYDKMEQIVKYLSGYEYTTTPGDVPSGADVVEYFLFESEAGYCMHFASAAAILGRCVGIPTRFVQGYLLDVERIGQHGRYNVNENQAHAWIECYLEGVGWLTFDATPGSSDLLYKDWGVPSYIGDKEDNKEGNTGNEGASGEGVGTLPGNTGSEGYIEKSTDNYFEIMPEDKYEDNRGEEVKKAKVRGVILAGVVLLILAVILYMKIRQNAFWESYEEASYSERLRIDLLLVIWMLNREGYVIKKEETLKAYIRRVAGFFPQKAKLMFEVSELYHKSRYGEKHEVTEAQQRKSERLRLSFTSEKVNMTAMTSYGHKILKSRFSINKI